ncbi:MAG: tetratricopeptide repeat protein [Candidatus Cloacimonetes bacterium]|nr:tetratricopeptide repeat protein [Candidatus Cloacimonadota bacterium]
MLNNLCKSLIVLTLTAPQYFSFANPFISQDPIAEDGYSEPTQYNFMPSPRKVSQVPVQRVAEPAQSPRLFSLLERCQSLGPWLGVTGEKADNARSLYAKNCADIVEKVALEQNLDVFFVGHATWLSQAGKHQEAHTWFTIAYQNQPQDLAVNVKLAQSFIALGQPEVALELLHFFRTNFPESMDPKSNHLLTQVETQAHHGLEKASAN